MTKRTKFFTDAPDDKRTNLAIPLIRGVTIFLIGLIVGWFVLGWVLFPVRYTNVYPNELHPEVVNDYLLMTAESYAATGDLRTAAKRLKYWEPEELASMFNDLANSIETTHPAGAAYLRILAQDLHLSSAPAPAAAPPAPRDFKILWLLLFLVIALIVLAALIKIAQRVGVLGTRPQPQSTSSQPGPQASPSSLDEPEASVTPPAPPLAIPAVADTAEAESLFDEEEITEPEDLDSVAMIPDEFPEEEPFFSPGETPPTPPEPAVDEPFPDGPLPEVETPEALPAPSPVEPVVVDEEELADTASPLTPQVFRFDGTPAYNTIAAIELNDEYLGEYGLSAGKTAPDNPNLVLTLEVWLFDKSDTQTVEAALVPAVVARDPALKMRYVGEDVRVMPLQNGEIILLETAELRLEGRVRRVEFGPATSDGVPVVNYAEIEMLGRRK